MSSPDLPNTQVSSVFWRGIWREEEGEEGGEPIWNNSLPTTKLPDIYKIVIHRHNWGMENNAGLQRAAKGMATYTFWNLISEWD